MQQKLAGKYPDTIELLTNSRNLGSIGVLCFYKPKYFKICSHLFHVSEKSNYNGDFNHFGVGKGSEKDSRFEA